MFEWYYVGQYGQLGPLSEEQMIELVESRVIVPESYVWKVGMSEWVLANTIPNFARSMAPPGPPPIPGMRPATPSPRARPPSFANLEEARSAIVSPCNKILAGVLQIFLPGVGRMYLGYLAIGVLQLVLAICSCGLLAIWSIVDGILIIAGNVPVDGYGRALRE